MPRSRRLNPRALAREAGRRGSRMRSWSGGRPDQATVLVEERLADGRYKVRRDSWPCSIYVPVTPAGSEIPTPRRMPLLFEQGNAQRPFLFWRIPLLGTGFVDGVEMPVALRSGWRTWHADFLRSNSWTDEPITPLPLDLADCETSATTWYGGATDALLRYERGPDFGDFPHWYGPRSYAAPDAPQSQGFGGSESANEVAGATAMGHTWNSILSSVEPDYSYFGEVSSLSRVDGILYAELEAWVYDYDAAEDRPASFACAIRVQGAIVDGSPATFGEVLWATRWQP